MTQELNFKNVEEITQEERCLIELGSRNREGGSSYYAVTKITRIEKGRYLLRVRGSDGQSLRMFVNSGHQLAVVRQELYDTFLAM